MPWSEVLATWHRHIERLCADFPYFDRTALERFRGNRDLLVTYLAETHDLTRREADACLNDWFAFTAR